MRSFRTFLLPLLVGSVLLLAGAIGQQPAGGPPTGLPKLPRSAKPRKAPKADPAGTKLLAEMVEQLDPKALPWLETQIWQQAALQGLTFQIDGSYHMAPGNRMHFDLKVQVGDTPGRLQLISDGTYFWDILEIGGTKVITKKVALKQALDLMKNPAVQQDMQREFFRNLSFQGIAPLLHSIKDKMTVTDAAKARWHDQDVTKLTAEWTAQEAARVQPSADRPWPAYLPRRAVIYVSEVAGKHWPARIEWWAPIGTGSPDADDSLVLQIEFREPRLNHELSPEEAAREYNFNPGKEPVRDETKQMNEMVQRMVQEMASQKRQTPGAKKPR